MSEWITLVSFSQTVFDFIETNDLHDDMTVAPHPKYRVFSNFPRREFKDPQSDLKSAGIENQSLLIVELLHEEDEDEEQ